MKTSTIVSLAIVCVLVVGAGLGTAFAVQSSAEKTIAAIKAQNEADAAALQTLRAEIASLRKDVADLKAEPGKIYVTSRPSAAGASNTDGPENADSPDATSTGPARPAARVSSATAEAPANEAMKEAVKQALAEQRQQEEDARKKEQEARQAEFQERMKTHMDEQFTSRGDMLVKELNLDSSQESRLRALLEERKTEMMASFAQMGTGGRRGGPPAEADRTKWMEAEKKFQEEIESILTQEQLQIYKEKNLGGMGPGGGGPWGGGNPGGGPGGGGR